MKCIEDCISCTNVCHEFHDISDIVYENYYPEGYDPDSDGIMDFDDE